MKNRFQCLFPACLLLLCVAAALSAGCGGESNARREITEVRQAAPDDLAPPRLSTADRFSTGTNPHGAMGMGATASATTPRYEWETPEGWEELPTTSMRLANIRVAGDPSAECYLSVLAGDGGGLLANINRWRAQMDLEPIDDAALAELPRKTLLGGEAVYVSLRGTFRGMQGDREEADYLLVGLVAVRGGQSYFVRMTGPAAIVENEVDRFDAFCASLREAAAAHGLETASGADGLHWDAPEGWELAPARPMRLVTYRAGGGACECRAFVLSGEAGGLAANINRWREQMGQAPLSADELAALPRWTVFGREAVYVEIAGDYTGMSGDKQPGQLFFGLVAPFGDSTLFVIMVGPEAAMAQERDHFAAFCQSMRQDG
ncbi:MAG TPA: hypothetical protein PKI11_17565 [Candidatus Hydrogenedentes bacterium]|nr:hypothetical protein [Candidatus Hydrogenedentota bacterium]HNT88744.1 hypothetical protein [Candidatus Hydrogenedentota bacterium]